VPIDFFIGEASLQDSASRIRDSRAPDIFRIFEKVVREKDVETDERTDRPTELD
jgi:hypothetical protein